MTTSFIDYAASAASREQVEKDITTYTLALCEALRQNYIDTSIKSHENFILNSSTAESDPNSTDFEYHTSSIAKLKQGISDYEYVIESGRKYHKIVMIARGTRSAHAFVDKKTGSVYKSATWKAPAKGERYNLMNEESREFLYENADWAGGYLYKN